MATQAELNNLKHQWRSDPCWPIEDTEGFEEHRAELLAYRQACESEWSQRLNDEIADKAAALQCSKALAIYIMQIERDLAELKERMNQ